ncbi:nucleotide exchange factor GrpE [Candidatus Gracilibacteria bacterium]|nr:nucleotide exchange factor GrpE [Candidatus Gracilibacteria bacterium]
MKKDPQLQRIAELEEQLELLQTDLELANGSKLRALADLENFQRREAENKKNWVSFGIAEFLKQILPRFLELKLGVEHSKDADLKKVVDNFFLELEKKGLQKITPKKGDSVDPEEHEVLATASGTPGTVVETLEPGWKFNNLILTPAKISAAQK